MSLAISIVILYLTKIWYHPTVENWGWSILYGPCYRILSWEEAADFMLIIFMVWCCTNLIYFTSSQKFINARILRWNFTPENDWETWSRNLECCEMRNACFACPYVKHVTTFSSTFCTREMQSEHNTKPGNYSCCQSNADVTNFQCWATDTCFWDKASATLLRVWRPRTRWM